MSKDSVYLNKKWYDIIGKLATNKQQTRSIFMNKLFYNLGLDKENVSPIVFQIPKSLLEGKEQELREWLDARVNGIIEHYYKNDSIIKDGTNTQTSQ